MMEAMVRTTFGRGGAVGGADVDMTSSDALFSSALGGFALCGRDGMVGRHNAVFATLMGVADAVPGPLCLSTLLHDEDFGPAMIAIGAVEQGDVRELEVRLKARDAAWRALRVAGAEDGVVIAIRDITRRMAAEAGEALFRRAFETASEPAVIADARAPDTPLAYVNDAFCAMTGYQRDEVVGRNCRFLQGLDRDQAGRLAIRAATAAGARVEATLRNYRKDETAFMNRVVISPLRDAEGRVTHFIGHQRDVTDAIEMQNSLRESEARYRHLVETPNVIAWRYDLSADRFVYVSPQAETLLGYPVAAWLEPGFWPDHVHPKDWRVVSTLRRKHILEGDDHSAEYRILRADGGVVWMRDTMRTTTDGGGRSAFIEGFMIDVTDRIEARRRAERNEAYLNAILETAPDAILTVDANLVIKSFNRAAEQVFGWPASEILGEDLSRLIPTEEGARAEMLAAHERLARAYVNNPEASAVIMGDWRRVRGMRRNGEEFPLMVSLNRIVVEESVTVTAIARDMTTIEKANRDLASLSRELAEQLILANEANVAKTQFLAAMSHELRTPLNAIIGFADIMARAAFGPIGSERYQRYTEDILASGTHLLALINDVLDLSRIEAGRANIRLEPVTLRAAAAEAMRLVRPMVGQAQLALRAAIGRDLPPVNADRRGVNQILLNLLSNAVKFTPPGGRVTLRAQPDGADAIRISVEDTGCGIPDDQIARLGQPFEQVGDIYRAEAQGTGLGLAITRSLAESMGGRMEIRSTLRVGTTVAIILPVQTDEVLQG